MIALHAWVVPGLFAFLAGAIGFAAIVYLGIKFNYKNLRTHYAHIPQDRTFYLAWALTGGVMMTAFVTIMPIIESYGIKDPWYGLIMIAVGMAVFFPMIFFLKRRRR
jgi:hypothetical protein